MTGSGEGHRRSQMIVRGLRQHWLGTCPSGACVRLARVGPGRINENETLDSLARLRAPPELLSKGQR